MMHLSTKTFFHLPSNTNPICSLIVCFQDPNQHAPEFRISGTDYTLRVKDTITEREVTLIVTEIHRKSGTLGLKIAAC